MPRPVESQRPRVAVVGAGALGQLLAAVIAHEGRASVSVVSRRSAVVDHVRALGIEVRRLATGEDVLRAYPPALLDIEAPASTFDLVLLLNKSIDLPGAIALARRIAAIDGVIVSLQNGLEPARALMAADDRGVPGTIYAGARYVGPGLVEHTVHAALVAAPAPTQRDQVAALLRAIDSRLLPSEIAADADAMLWEKLVGAVSNALSGALLKPVSELTRSVAAWEILEQARGEVLDVAVACGVQIDRDRIAATWAGRPINHHNIGSTYQSLLSARPTEVPELLGSIERSAQRVGVPTPVLTTLRRLVAAREELLP